MALRPRGPLPIPAEDLAQLQEQLDEGYSSHLWSKEGRHVLVARVPSDGAPDLVNDLLGIVELGAPRDVQQATECLVVTGRQVHSVPIAPLRELMAERVAFDRRQCRMLRTQLPGVLSHTLYRAPDDPSRRLRLAIRLPCDKVSQMQDKMLYEVADQLGHRLEKGELEDLHCVYLIATHDDVRIEAGLFLKDLRATWEDAGRLRSMDLAIARREDEKKHLHHDREDFLDDLQRQYGQRVAYAPVRHKTEIHDRVDRIPNAPTKRAARSGSAVLDALAERLQRAEFDVRPRPGVEGHRVDLAAERAEGYPQRVIAIEEEKLTLELAEAILATCKRLDVDLAIVICDTVHPEAARRIVATKIRTLRDDELDRLDL